MLCKVRVETKAPSSDDYVVLLLSLPLWLECAMQHLKSIKCSTVLRVECYLNADPIRDIKEDNKSKRLESKSTRDIINRLNPVIFVIRSWTVPPCFFHNHRLVQISCSVNENKTQLALQWVDIVGGYNGECVSLKVVRMMTGWHNRQPR